MTRDTVVGILGAIVIVTASIGLFIVEGRSGPATHGLATSEVVVEATGSYEETRATGTVGPGGTCIPDAPQTACTPARSKATMRFGGLPQVPGAHYVAFLDREDGAPVRLGALAVEGDTRFLSWEEATDGRSFTTLIVTLHTGPEPAGPNGLVVYQDRFGPVEPGSEARFADTYIAMLGSGEGQVTVDQIGAVEVSATADATLSGARLPDGWTFRAWFLEERAGTAGATDLGPFETIGDGTHVLDSRVERVDLSDQRRFVVTLVPAGVETGTTMIGFPAYHLVL